MVLTAGNSDVPAVRLKSEGETYPMDPGVCERTRPDSKAFITTSGMGLSAIGSDNFPTSAVSCARAAYTHSAQALLNIHFHHIIESFGIKRAGLQNESPVLNRIIHFACREKFHMPNLVRHGYR